jgi:L-aspartate oxidase
MPESSLSTDVLVVGAGAAGLSVALHLPDTTRVVVVDKGGHRPGSSPWAQGGVAAALGAGDSPDLHAQDTIRVAAGHADATAVAVLCSEAPECVLELAELGCEFDRTPTGELHLAREGGQTVARSAHAADATGAAIMKTLRQHATPRVTRIEGTCVALAVSEGRCVGGWVLTDQGLVSVQSNSTVIATGGVGGLFSSTTNPPGATGDGIALAWEAGAGLADVEFVQFHPTTLATTGGLQRPLLTEALRGAGAHVVDAEGRRFLFEFHDEGELAPRDIVARAVAGRSAWLDCRHIDAAVLRDEFRSVHQSCLAAGLDPSDDLLPIVPAAHYFVGGIQTDLDGRASIPRLYAVGESATTGVHGANRLAGNSLAEALVFGRRAARAIAGQRLGAIKELPPAPELRSAPATPRIEWTKLRGMTTNGLGIERDERELHTLIYEAEQFTTLPLSGSQDMNELRSAAIVMRLMARAALLRRESRGVHFRRDHPEPDPAWAGVRLRFSRGMAPPSKEPGFR